METLFEIVNIWMMPWWAIWIWAPQSGISGWLARRPWPVLFPVLIYIYLIGWGFADLIPQLMHPQLGPIAGFLGEPSGAFAGWVHFLVMDYLVGAWVVFRYQACFPNGNSWVIRLVLLMTLMLGPIGAIASFLFIPPKAARGDSAI